jgi:hypothetical protein
MKYLNTILLRFCAVNIRMTEQDGVGANDSELYLGDAGSNLIRDTYRPD